MICPNCQSENEPGRKFCGECGTRLSVTCSNCGTANTPGTKFCGECGTALAGAAPAAADPSPQPAVGPTAERRLVSVLFADLVGFTTMSEGRDPEETRDVLNAYFETTRSVIERYGGIVEKFIGDAVMAVWGTPTAHEDDAERGVRAALELVDAVHAIDTGSDQRLSARAAVLTGEAAVTIGATGQGMVAGDLVNTASRLQGVAPPGSVLVGDATRQAAAEAIAFEEIEPQHLKGKQLPVAAWQALRVVAQRGGVGRASTLEPPFVGRDDELRLLKELLHATAREQRPRLVSIIGTAGIGKSRLAWELLKYVDGVVEDVYWHEGRSPAYGEGVTFWALGEMVRRRAEIAETDDPTTASEKLRLTVAEYVPDEEERRTIEPRLAGLLGLEPMPPGEREQLFSAWRSFFERIAERGTTTLIFEDLHWADPGLLDFIEHVLEWARSKPILIVTLARPELLDRRPGWGSRQRNFAAIHLEPLPDEAMRDLVHGTVPGVSDELARRIVERAEGMPLYAVELLRMLVSEGRLVPEDGKFVARGELAKIEVPASLQALLAARLDALDPADRALLQSAAVLGQSFTTAALEAVSGADPDALDGALQRMSRGELIGLDTDPQSPERGQYRFLQGLTREVAYGMLARPERRSRHVAAARHYEQLGDDELASVLATHYLEAYRTAQPGLEADALAAQARVALRAAADRATALHSHEQALALLGEALEISRDGIERTQLWERAAEAAFALSRIDVAAEYAEQALEWYRSSGDQSQALGALHRLGRIQIFSGQPELGVEVLERALTSKGPASDGPEWAAIYADLARAYLLSESASTPTAKILDLTDRALAIAERHDLGGVVDDALITRGTVLGMDGRAREATALLRAAADSARAEGHALNYMRALGNLSFVQSRDDPRACQVSAETGLAEAVKLGMPAWIGFLAGNAAGAAWYTGAWERIAELYDIDKEWSGGRFGSRALLAEVLAFRGDGAKANELLAEDEASLKGVTEPQLIQGDAHSRSVVALGLGDRGSAVKIALDAIPLSDSLRFDAVLLASRAAFWSGDAEAHEAVVEGLSNVKDHGRYIDAIFSEVRSAEAALTGGRSDAAAGFRDTVRRWRELDLPLSMAFSLMSLAATSADQAEVAEARAEARSLLESLGAGHFASLLEGWLPSVSRVIAGAPTAGADVETAQARPG